MTCYCYICYGLTEPEFLCDSCDNYYCEDCTYIFSPHYQFQGARCYKCADQYRITPLIKNEVRDNKIRFFSDEDGVIFPL
jgi:hypothetical protein